MKKSIFMFLSFFLVSFFYLNAEETLPYDPKGENVIGYLYVGGHEESISDSTWLYIKQGLEYYKKNKPRFILLELNTPGGEVFAAQKISDALREMDIQYDIPIVAFINDWAISAGAMLAYSSRFIATVTHGSMGAAEPVYAGSEGKMETASEKVNSAIRTDFGNRAAIFGRNSLIAEGMVDKDLIIVEREGKIIRLNQESQIKLEGPNPDLLISPKGKLLTLNGANMIAYGVANFIVPESKITSLTAEEESTGIWPANKSLLFHSPAFAAIPNATIHAYKMDWKTKFFVFLANPLISSLLMMALMIGAYMEFSNPGLTFPGFVAASSLFLILLSNYALQLSDSLEIILLLTGLSLIFLEIFVLGGFGLLGFLGIFLFFGALLLLALPGLSTITFNGDAQSWQIASEYFMNRLTSFMVAILLSFIFIIILARYITPKWALLNRLVLSGHEQDASRGYTAGEQPQNMPSKGDKGKVLSALRPGGKIIVAGKIFDAVATNDLISEEEVIVVQRVEGSTVFVTRL